MKTSILVVELDPNIRTSFCDILMIADYVVDGVADFASALRILCETPYDLVLAPINPTQAVEDFITSLRACETTNHVPILMYGFARFLKSLTVQPNHFLAAWFTPKEVIDAVEKALK